MAKYTTLNALFTAIADSLRAKTGNTGKIVADDFPSVIDALSANGGSGIIPTGTKTITSNGTHDVKNYATAEVNVPTGSDNYHVLPITIPGFGGTAAKENVILSSNAFVKAHYADEAFFVILMPLNAADSIQPAATTSFLYAGNRALANSKSIVYGVRTIGAGSSSYASAQNATAKISGNGYNIALRTNSSGNIIVYTAANMYVPAGDYLLILALAEPTQ